MTALLEFRAVEKTYPSGHGPLRVVRDVSFSLQPGEILTVVGERGCGKTTTGKLACGLVHPTLGQVLFKGSDTGRLGRRDRSGFRRAVQLIHQDPYASLNPVRTVFQTLSAPLRRLRVVRGSAETQEKVCGLLRAVDLTPPADFLAKFPHQLSGEQRQRVAVARALAVNPEFIVADESVSMLDVSIRASLLNTLLRLNRERGVAYLFITHDLAVARYFGWQGKMAVMYLGRVVEYGPTPEVTGHPSHPYTQALIASLPVTDPHLARAQAGERVEAPDVPSLHQLPPGCAYHPRCPLRQPGSCDRRVPELAPVTPGSAHAVACPVASGRTAEAQAG